MQTAADIGLGYAGLPLVVEFGDHGRTISFDVVEANVATYRAGTDLLREHPDAEIAQTTHAQNTASRRRREYLLRALATTRYPAACPPRIGTS